MSELLPNYVAGKWVAGAGAGAPLVDPVTNQELARVSSDGQARDNTIASQVAALCNPT